MPESYCRELTTVNKIDDPMGKDENGFIADEIGAHMPQEIPAGQSMLFIRRDAYERSGITRQSIDERLNLTAEEFRVEGGLVMIGPIPDDAELRDILDDLEEAGLVYFDEYFELTGNWPGWIRLYVADR